MMIGHLTFAGLAELVVSGGVVAYLQRADPVLLKLTAPDAPDRDRMDIILGEGTVCLRSVSCGSVSRLFWWSRPGDCRDR